MKFILFTAKFAKGAKKTFLKLGGLGELRGKREL